MHDALWELHLHWFRDKLLYDIDYVQVSKATYYKLYNRKSIQTMYSISKSTFNLIKPVEIYKVHLIKLYCSNSDGYKLIRAQLTNTSQ